MNRRFILRYMIYGVITIVFIQVIFLFNVLSFFSADSLEYVKQNSAQNSVEGSHCKIVDKQMKSALKRAKSDVCRRKLIDVYCQLQDERPWNSSLTSRCPNFDKEFQRQPLGCLAVREGYLEQKAKRKKKRTKLLNNTSLEACKGNCVQYDFQHLYYFNSTCLCSNENNISTDICDIYDPQTSTILVYPTGLNKKFFIPDLAPLEPSSKVKIVFLLQLNGRSYLQVNRLLKNIYKEHHYYYIHVDSRQEYLYRKLSYLEKFPNIVLTRHRFATIWGGASLLEMMFACMKDILTLWPDWDFVLNLSETDFPIKPIDELEHYLGQNLGRNFLRSHGKNAFDFVHSQAMMKLFYECDEHLWRIANRPLIKGLVMDGGSDWFVLSRNFANYVIFQDDNSKQMAEKDELLSSLKSFYKYSLLPAESFFHIFARNSEFCSTIVNSNLRITNWNRKKGCHCQHQNVVDWCGCSPNTFRLGDYHRLQASQTKPLFFARKFEHSIDSSIVDAIQRRLLLPLLSPDNNEEEDSSTLSSSSFHRCCENNHSIFIENAFDRNFDSLSVERQWFYGELEVSATKEIIRLVKKNIHSRDLKTGNEIESVLNYQIEPLADCSLTGKVVDVYGHFVDGVNDGLVLRFANNVQAFVKWNVVDSFVILVDDTIQTIKVCDRFDVKEEIFRDFECLCEKSIQVLHEWSNRTEISRAAAFLFVNPFNTVKLVKTQQVNDTKLFFELSHDEALAVKQEPGIWKIITLDDDSKVPLAILKFAVYGKNRTHEGKDYENVNGNINTMKNDKKSARKDRVENEAKKRTYIVGDENRTLAYQSAIDALATNTFFSRVSTLWDVDKLCIERTDGASKHIIHASLNEHPTQNRRGVRQEEKGQTAKLENGVEEEKAKEKEEKSENKRRVLFSGDQQEKQCEADKQNALGTLKSCAEMNWSIDNIQIHYLLL